jgi:glutamate carboxypeptidase
MLPHLRVKVLLTTDASLGNKYSEGVVQQEAALCKRVLCFKPCGGRGEVVTRRSGMGYFYTAVEGDEMHMTADEVTTGTNAIDELAHKIRAWNRLSDPPRGNYVYVNSLRSEERTSVLPDHCHATIFLSFQDTEEGERLVREIKKIAKRSFVPGSRCVLTTDIMRTPFSETEQVTRLYGELARVAESIGRPLGTIARCNASEVNVVPLGVPALDGLGPVGYETRTGNEHIEARTLVERAVLLALYMRSLAIEARDQ